MPNERHGANWIVGVHQSVKRESRLREGFGPGNEITCELNCPHKGILVPRMGPARWGCKLHIVPSPSTGNFVVALNRSNFNQDKEPMSKKYTAKEITETLVNLSNALASQTPQFPGLIPVIRAMTEAAKNPTKSFENTKAEAPKVKPVSISYEGESLLVRNTPYSDYKLRQELAAFVGVETKKVNPDTNKPY